MRLVNYNPQFTTRWNNWLDTDFATNPSVNITEKENGFYVEVVSPGLNKDDFKIELNKRQLTITAEKKSETEKKEGDKIWQKEFSLSSFKRSFYLPETVEADAIEASYEQGILKVYIPKKAEVIPAVKSIEIA